MRWIYLSPHLDDAVLSCGGLIWQQVRNRQSVEIWTLCAGDQPPGKLTPFAAELHARWQTGTQACAARRAEDAAACEQVGAIWRHWEMPDCIYRRDADGEPLIQRNEDLWVSSLHPRTAQDVARVRAWLAQTLPPQAHLVVPLTIGNHIDHHIARTAAESLGRHLWYYPDYPYVDRHQVDVRAWLGAAWSPRKFAVSPAALRAWQQGIAQYTSQISSFWGSLEEMRLAIQRYHAAGGGCILWQRHTP